MPARSTMGRATTATPEVERTAWQMNPSYSTAEFAVRHLMVAVNAVAGSSSCASGSSSCASRSGPGTPQSLSVQLPGSRQQAGDHQR